ncbi:MAG TPA: methionine adenosyltransferase [Myxococcota bacterium]|nr:methionine adenosyltransferase [Myxococcota bacterium]
MSVVVRALEGASLEARPVEVVERKGLGHPDTICDALAEEASRALSRHYLERFGFVLHHNVDKVLLRGGASRAAFGGGEVLEPIEIFLAGRATREYRGAPVPVDALVQDACTSWLRSRLHALDPDRHVRLHCLLRPGSVELVELFERQRRTGRRLANDTSIGVGYAPSSRLERAVLDAERALNAREQRAAAPERGEDVKVMGVREGGRIELTIACAFVDRSVRDAADYLAKRERAAALARAAAGGEAEVRANAADDPDAGSLYLTVTGTSAEAGDDGQTGRGNRANGLITPGRPMTLESIAGKNPITHVGKLYNVAAPRLAAALVRELEHVREAQVLLVSRIGQAIDDPQLAELALRVAEPRTLDALAPRAREIARAELAALGDLWRQLLSCNLAEDAL